jgi:2'-hydroxyisoflavone reductase
MRAMLEGCRKAASNAAEPVWADPAFLAEQGLAFPIWSPPEGETAGFHRVSVARAVAAGLRFRSIEETARDTLAWHAALPDEAKAQVLPPITLEREAEVLALWKESAPA